MVKFIFSDLTPAGQPSGHEMHGYLSRDDDSSGLRPIKDTQTIGSAYDRYLRSVVSSDTLSFIFYVMHIPFSLLIKCLLL